MFLRAMKTEIPERSAPSQKLECKLLSAFHVPKTEKMVAVEFHLRNVVSVTHFRLRHRTLPAAHKNVAAHDEVPSLLSKSEVNQAADILQHASKRSTYRKPSRPKRRRGQLTLLTASLWVAQQCGFAGVSQPEPFQCNHTLFGRISIKKPRRRLCNDAL
jgi:hypothetical protein